MDADAEIATSSRVTVDSRLSFDEGVAFLRAKMLEESKEVNSLSLSKKCSLNLLDANQDEKERFLNGKQCVFSKLFPDYSQSNLQSILAAKVKLQAKSPVQVALTYGTMKGMPVLLRKCRIQRSGDDYQIQLDSQIAVHKPISEKFGVPDNHRFVKVKGRFNFEKAISALNEQNEDVHSKIHTSAIISLFYDYDASTFSLVTRTLENNPQATASNMLQAFTGDIALRRAIKMYNNNSYEALFRDGKYFDMPDLAPDDESGVGDLDLQERLLIRGFAEMKSMNVLSPANMKSSKMIAAMIAQSATQGERTLLVSSGKSSINNITSELKDLGLESLLLDLTLRKNSDYLLQEGIRKAIKTPALTIGGYSPDISRRLKKVSDELQSQAETFTKLFQPWNISIEQLIQNIASSAELPEFNTRLSRDTCINTLGKQDALAGEIGKLLDLDYTLAARGSNIFQSNAPINYWVQAKIHHLEDTYEIVQKLERLLDVLLPSVMVYVDEITAGAGLKAPNSIAQWNQLCDLLSRVRHTLDVFTNDIFDRDISEYIDVTAPKDNDAPQKKAEFNFFEKNRLLKEANLLLRPGQNVPNLHESLKEAAYLRKEWLRLSAKKPDSTDLLSNSPLIHLPNQVGKAISLSRSLNVDLKAVDAIFEESEQFDTLFELDFESLKALLSSLILNKDSLQQVFERTHIIDELHSLGVGYLAMEMSDYKIGCADVKDALQKVLSLSILGYILDSSDDLEIDAYKLEELHTSFKQLDSKHIENLNVPVKYFAGQKQSSALTNLDLKDGVPEDVDTFIHDYFTTIAVSKNALGAIGRSLSYFDTVIINGLEICDLPYVYATLLLSKRVVIFGDSISKDPQLADLFKDVVPTFEFEQIFSARDILLSKIIIDNGFPGLKVLPQNTRIMRRISFRKGVDKISNALRSAIDIGASKTSYRIAIVAAEGDIKNIRNTLKDGMRDDKTLAALASRFERKKGHSISIISLNDLTTTYDQMIFFMSDALEDVPDKKIIYAFISVLDRLHVVADAKVSSKQVIELLKVLENGAKDALSLTDAKDFLDSDEGDVAQLQYGKNEWSHELERYSQMVDSLKVRLEKMGYNTIANFNLRSSIKNNIPLCIFDEDLKRGVAVLIDQFMHEHSLRYALRFKEQNLRALGWEVVHLTSMLYHQNPALALSKITDALLDESQRESSKSRSVSMGEKNDARAREILNERPPHHNA
ncbi:MAG: hypothetical protein LBC50_00935 [Candidatus Ancillula sp.]|nr:hypothetical protein [Candidatus Ancillula sp.]